MQRSFGADVALIIVKAVVVLLTIGALILTTVAFFEVGTGVSDGTCNIAVLPIEGEIWPFYGMSYTPLIVTPEMVETSMEAIEGDDSIQAVLLEINSPGGLPVASERIAERLRNSPLPTVGLIGDIGASGGYMIAAATDYLIASPMSIVGSIGVTMSYVEQSKQNEEEGLTYVELNTGKFKDSGSPDKPLSDEERELFQRDLDDLYETFITMVSNYRTIPLEKVRELADGSTLNGTRAKDAGLTDEVGGRPEAKVALAKILNIEVDEVVFCEYTSPLLPF
jgi:protease IV